MQKKFLIAIVLCANILVAKAQQHNNDSLPPTSETKNFNTRRYILGEGPADHVMLQFGYHDWAGQPDSLSTKGFSDFFNFYFMMNKQLRPKSHFSVAGGVGMSWYNTQLNNSYANIAATSSTMPLANISAVNGSRVAHFNKFKLTQVFVEIPLEFRFYSNPANTDKSWKAAIGAKIGVLLKSYTKGNDWLDNNGNSVYGSNYIRKEQSNNFFNPIKLSGTIRVGYSFASIHCDYSFLGVLKQNAGPTLNTIAIGLTISGL